MSKMVVRNERLSDEEFFKIRREEVLPQWKTSKDIENLDENIAAAKEMSRGKNMALKFMEAKKSGKHVLIAAVRAGAHRIHDRGHQLCRTGSKACAGRHVEHLFGFVHAEKQVRQGGRRHRT